VTQGCKSPLTATPSTRDLDYLRYGVATARCGWLTADEVIHTWPLDRLREFLRKKTDMAAAKLARERV
jgi:protoporphyrinogen oxidase